MYEVDKSCVMPSEAKDHDRKFRNILITLTVGLIITAGFYKLEAPAFLWIGAGVATWVAFGIMMARCPSCRKGICVVPTH